MIYFKNEGVIEPKALMTFGVSAKLDDSAIGYFGTGFKYAVAVILRGGGTISIDSGEDHYTFYTKTYEHRGKSFETVLMNGEEMNFTTALGRNWEQWMAYRELYCNAMDEGGVVDTSPTPSYETVIKVDCPAIEKAHVERGLYINAQAPLERTQLLDILPKAGGHIFYKNIAVHQLQEPSVLSYNVRTSVTLTEDRTAKYLFEVHWAIRDGIASMTNERALRKILSAPRGTFEHGIDYGVPENVSPVFIDVAKRLLKLGHLVEGAREVLEVAKQGDWPTATLTRMQRTMLNRAIKFLTTIDVHIDKPIIVESLGNDVMGRAYEGEIYVALLAFNMGTKQLASTLLEEHVHCKYGVADFSRGMQNWLFDKVLSMGEEARGEPL